MLVVVNAPQLTANDGRGNNRSLQWWRCIANNGFVVGTTPLSLTGDASSTNDSMMTSTLMKATAYCCYTNLTNTIVVPFVNDLKYSRLLPHSY